MTTRTQLAATRPRSSLSRLAVWCALWCVSSTIARAEEIQQDFRTFKSFVQSAPDRVLAYARVKPLDRSEELDRQALEAVEKINRYTHLTEMPPPIHWADGLGSCAHPEAGLLIDRQQLVQLRDAIPAEPFPVLLMFVIAHETSHMRQYKECGRGVLFDVNRTRELELQADILGAAVVMTVGLREGWESHQRGVTIPAERISGTTNFLPTLGRLIGHPAWEDRTAHPRWDQRMIGSIVGYMGAMQKIVGENFIGLTKDGKTEQAEAVLREFTDYDRRNPFMPRLDRESLAMERGFDWSARVARVMVQDGFFYAEEVRKHRARNSVPEP